MFYFKKKLFNQKGFTLVELMTVLIILSIVLAIGVPKYLQIQAKAGWEADADSIINFARTAEVYAASNNHYEDVTLGILSSNGLIDGSLVLNRKNNGSNVSVKNKGEGNEVEAISTTHAAVPFSFNINSGKVNNLGKVIQHLIGNPPYGGGPSFPGDDAPEVDWKSINFIAVENLPNITP